MFKEKWKRECERKIRNKTKNKLYIAKGSLCFGRAVNRRTFRWMLNLRELCKYCESIIPRIFAYVERFGLSERVLDRTYALSISS